MGLLEKHTIIEKACSSGSAAPGAVLQYASLKRISSVFYKPFMGH